MTLKKCEFTPESGNVDTYEKCSTIATRFCHLFIFNSFILKFASPVILLILMR